MRCMICDCTIFVGKDNLCRKCRAVIKKTKRMEAPVDTDEEIMEYESNYIDTRIADWHTQQDNMGFD